MTVRTESSSRTRFATSILLWLLAGGMLSLYLLTLDHWVSPESLHSIASLSGLTWLTELSAPLTWLVTYPIRWLPGAWIPVASNLFAAIYAALTLVLLARCVALLPHDRTREERQRNLNKLGFLTTNNAWLPPVMAVLVCGLQVTFWEHSVMATGEMFDLLLFAWLVRCLLEFRMSQEDSWLMKFAFVLGLAMANNWAMVAFFPGFLLAVFWMKGGFKFFSPRFVAQFLDESADQINFRVLLRMLVWGLAGFSFFLLLPTAAALSHRHHVAFWPALRFSIYSYERSLMALRFQMIVMLSLTSVLPVLFMGIRWGRLVQQSQAWADSATTILFHVIHGFFLLLCLWAALGSPFSPRQIQPLFPCLPLYFLAALSVGYYSGYFLLVFGQRTIKSRQQSPEFLNMASIAVMWALLFIAPAILAYRNLPGILRERGPLLADYFELLEKSMPPRGAAILSEDAARLQYLEARLIQVGRQTNYALIDTVLLAQYPNYLKFLTAKYPNFNLALPASVAGSQITNAPVLTRWMLDLSQKHEIYFLHPCAGYISEKFFTQQRGLLFQLRPYPTNALSPPSLTAELVSENQSFWAGLREGQFSKLLPRLQTSPDWWRRDLASRIVRAIRPPPETDRRARLVGLYYSLGLNSWGVDLQKSGRLAEAGQSFEQARQLNPENAMAQINLQCNQDLQAHAKLAIDPARRVEDKFGRGRDWDQVLRQDGPADEPNACFRLGTLCLEHRMFRQAIQEFQRAETLAPESIQAPLRLSELFLRIGDFTNSLAEAERSLRLDGESVRGLDLKGISLVQMRQFDRAVAPLSEAINIQATNTDALIARAFAYLKTDKLSAAKEDYELVAAVMSKAYPAYFGLANIAYQMKDTPGVVKNCELYLTNAPASLPEETVVKQWLEEAKTGFKSKSK